MLKSFFSLIFLLQYQVLLSQQQALANQCDSVLVPHTVLYTEKDSLVRLIRIKENPGCIWRDRETGFDKKVSVLLKITTLSEKIELFKQNSASLKYYLFPSILIENDSIGYDLFRQAISDTTPLYRLCSCVAEDDVIGLRLSFLYYGFIWLKYHECASGTIEGNSFWIGSKSDLKSNRRKWGQKVNQFKTVVRNVIPDFRNYLLPSQQKAWN